MNSSPQTSPLHYNVMDDSIEGKVRPKRVGLALSGGGSRAIAYHLGCLRALRTAGILGEVRVVSGVSGGAVLSALYAYRDESFEAFEEEVIALLRRGLLGSIAKRLLWPPNALRAVATALTAGVAAKATQGASIVVSALSSFKQSSRAQPHAWYEVLRPPLPRWFSRSDAFHDALRRHLFGDLSITAPRRNDVDVVLNATELQTGTAFRFGSRASSNWRFGRVKDNSVTVAEAVAASAAYPVFLPAFHRSYSFVKRDGAVLCERVILTDGGVFDNLGVSCLESGRGETEHVYDCDALVCCHAGMGQWPGHGRPYGWTARMSASMLTTFRKNEDGAKTRLFGYLSDPSSKLKAMVLSSLGQKDGRLHRDFGHAVPADLVPREAVVHYPTDFNPMPQEDISLLTRRGEQVTRLLVEAYWPG